MGNSVQWTTDGPVVPGDLGENGTRRRRRRQAMTLAIIGVLLLVVDR
jgi:hypothetical protein